MPSQAAALLALALALPVSAAAGGAAGQQPLPPEECVRMVRSARIAGMAGDSGEELRLLRAAVAAFPDEMSPLYSLLDYFRRHPASEEEYRRLQGLLLARLKEPQRALPAALLYHFAHDPTLDQGTLRLVEEEVSRRLSAPAEPTPDLLTSLAMIQQRLGDLEGAVEALERRWKLTGSEADLGALAQQKLRMERWSEAGELLALLVEREEGWRPGYALALIRAGRLPEGLRQLELLEGEMDPADPWDRQQFAGLLETAAWDLRDAARDGEAEELFRRVLETDPENPRVGVVLLHLYGSEEERQALAAAAERRWQQASDPQALFDEGTQRLAAGDAAGAIELLERAAPQLPNLEAAWFNLGMAAYRLERWETVEKALLRSSQLNPGRAQGFLFRGIALAKLERCTEALEPLEMALERNLDRARAQAHYYLYACHYELGNREAAAHHHRLYREAAEP